MKAIIIYSGQKSTSFKGAFVLPLSSNPFKKNHNNSTADVKMATLCSEVTANLASKDSGNEIHAILRRCRGRPRLSDTDRARRRLESRKKYDVRRVYLGESHKVWSDLRQKSCMSDAGLAEYLILLNSAYGEKYQQKYCLYAQSSVSINA